MYQIVDPWGGTKDALKYYARSKEYQDTKDRTELMRKGMEYEKQRTESQIAARKAQEKRAEKSLKIQKGIAQSTHFQNYITYADTMLQALGKERYPYFYKNFVGKKQPMFGDVMLPEGILPTPKETAGYTDKQWEVLLDGISSKRRDLNRKLEENAALATQQYNLEYDFKKRSNELALTQKKAIADADAIKAKKLADIEIEKARKKQEMGDSDRKYSDKLNQQKFEAYDAFLKGEATPEQIKAYGLDKDVYLAQAAKFISEDPEKSFLPADEKIKEIIKLAETIREASMKKQNDPHGIRELLFRKDEP